MVAQDLNILIFYLKLIFYDQRTSGGSISSTDSSSITLGNFVEDLEGIRKAFDLDKMNLLGHSWGGMLAMFYATKYPKNLNSLMLISSGGARSDFWNDFIQNINHNRTTKDSLALANLEATEELKNNNIAALQKYFKIFFKAYFYNQTFGDSLTMKFSKTTAKNMSLIDSKPLGQVLN
jgi:proline iminopeptidase